MLVFPKITSVFWQEKIPQVPVGNYYVNLPSITPHSQVSILTHMNHKCLEKDFNNLFVFSIFDVMSVLISLCDYLVLETGAGGNGTVLCLIWLL